MFGTDVVYIFDILMRKKRTFWIGLYWGFTGSDLWLVYVFVFFFFMAKSMMLDIL